MNPKAPCFIKDDEETYIYLILPVNFNAASVKERKLMETITIKRMNYI